MSVNTLAFLLTTIKSLETNFIPVWVFGGWGEELWQIARPRGHSDIDFLYPAADFENLDRFIGQWGACQEIQLKHFSHKRGVIYQQIRIEFLLVQNKGGIYFTDFFEGKYHLEWPTDLFTHRVILAGHQIHVASKLALHMYRQNHRHIDQAYKDFLIDSERRIVSEF